MNQSEDNSLLINLEKVEEEEEVLSKEQRLNQAIDNVVLVEQTQELDLAQAEIEKEIARLQNEIEQITND